MNISATYFVDNSTSSSAAKICRGIACGQCGARPTSKTACDRFPDACLLNIAHRLWKSHHFKWFFRRGMREEKSDVWKVLWSLGNRDWAQQRGGSSWYRNCQTIRYRWLLKYASGLIVKYEGQANYTLMHTSSPHSPSPSDPDDEELRSYFDGVTKGCDVFRILLLGKSGCGKSTLVSEVFDFDLDDSTVSHYTVSSIQLYLRRDASTTLTTSSRESTTSTRRLPRGTTSH